ncbi:MAG: hypothetical protein ACLPIX_10585 [Rhodomicrobium sp.]
MSTTRKLYLVFITLFCLTLPCLAQTSSADDAYRLCSPILNSIISDESYFQQGATQKSTTVTYFCSLNFTSEQEAQSAGLKIGFEIDGIPIGLLFSSDSKKRMDARTKLCSLNTVDTNSAWGQVLLNLHRDRSVPAEYQKCVQEAMTIQKQDLYCYSNSIAGTGDVVFTVGYRPDSLRTSKLKQARLMGPFVDAAGKTDVSDQIRATQKRQGQPLHAFQPIEIPAKRKAQGAGSLEVTLDDGQACRAAIGPIPYKWDGNIIALGAWLGSNAAHTFSIDAEKDCGDGTDTRYQEVCIDTGLVLNSSQNASQVYNRSSNCPRDASYISNIRRKSDSCASVEYRLKGCGYDTFGLNCKGSGWLRASGFLQARLLDTTKGTTFPHSFQGTDNDIGVRFEAFGSAIPADFRYTDMAYQLNISVPSAGGYKAVSLFSGSDPGIPVCQDILVDQQTVGYFAYLKNAQILVFGEVARCESLGNLIGKVWPSIVQNTPEGRCSQSGLRRSEKTSDKITGPEMFSYGCRP